MIANLNNGALVAVEKVLLDGVLVRLAMHADDEKGEVECYYKDEMGHLAREGEFALTKILKGDVKIILYENFMYDEANKNFYHKDQRR